MATAYVSPYMVQDAAYWPPASVNDGYGGITYGMVQLIKCRWQDVQTVMRDAQGDEFVTDAVVYPNTEVVEGGLLALGDFSGDLDSSGDLDHLTIPGAREIRKVNQSPERLTGRILFKAML